MYENVVIGIPEEDIIKNLLAYDEKDWEEVEKEKTLFTDNRFLPKILVDCGIAKSNSEVRRNRPELVRELTERDFVRVKWGKKYVFIIVFPN